MHTTLPPLSTPRDVLTAATDGDGNVLFGGGYATAVSAVVDKYTPDGVRSTLTPLSAARQTLAAATDGNGNVLFGGGGSSSVVDKYYSPTDKKIEVPIYARYKFAEHDAELIALASPITVNAPNTGYIRFGGKITL